MEWVELIKQLSILIGIWVAIYGLDSWHREHKGKRQMELAEDTLALFFEARDAITHIRHPMSYAHETDDVERIERETEQQWEARKNASVVFTRYNAYQELFSKIRAMRYRFMAQFGQEASKPFDELQSIVGKIIASARTLSRLWARDHIPTEERWNKHLDAIEKNEAVFWEGASDEDPINPQLDSVIAEMEKTCSRIIRGDKSLAAMLNRPIFPNRGK